MTDAKQPAPRAGRETVARHARETRHPLIRALSVVGVVVAVLATSIAGVAAYTVWDTVSALEDSSVELVGNEVLPPSIGEIEGGVNVLLVGSDSCEGQDLTLFPRCANNDAEGERNDVTMLVHISDEPRRVTVVSFPRDMIVPIPSCPDGEGGQYSAMSAQPLNASYMYGGLPCTALTIEELTGEEIHFAAAIRWTGVIDMSDAIGGVDVCVAGDISDVHTGLSLSEGGHTLQGVQALQFLRIRHGIGDGSDLGRISNQQQFMSSMVRKLKSDAVLGDPQTLLRFATTAVGLTRQDPPQLVLSSDLANPMRMVQIAMAAKDVPFEDIVFVQYPTEYDADFVHVLPVRDAADVLFAALRENQAVTLTGEASQGYGVEVRGEVESGEAAEPAPEGEGDAGTGETDAAPEAEGEAGGEAAAPTERVELPSQIAGTTAAEVTCTRPES
ncbi:LCP family protein [Microbacterium sp. NPDC077184]|uniref:LCP family protein n=1 Tax=Microbacterium sp. NPDC077184 TaxID=3154764 RepID=UPI0034267704